MQPSKACSVLAVKLRLTLGAIRIPLAMEIPPELRKTICSSH